MNKCSRKRSDMTPCVLDDGFICLADDGVCVGCGETIWLNIRQAARMAGVHENTVRRLIDRGVLEAKTLPGPSGYRRVNAAVLARYTTRVGQEKPDIEAIEKELSRLMWQDTLSPDEVQWLERQLAGALAEVRELRAR